MAGEVGLDLVGFSSFHQMTCWAFLSQHLPNFEVGCMRCYFDNSISQGDNHNHLSSFAETFICCVVLCCSYCLAIDVQNEGMGQEGPRLHALDQAHLPVQTG